MISPLKIIFFALLAFSGCKAGDSAGSIVPDQSQNIAHPDMVVPVVPSVQNKYYLAADDDLKGKVGKGTSGVKVLLLDSKFYAVGERILSVSYSADGDIVNDGTTVTSIWASQDPVNRPAVLHAPGAAEFGILCLPGEYKGKFIVKTSRYDYEFTKDLNLSEGSISSVILDFAAPDIQPIRRVGILGDSISTFAGVSNPSYSPWYPTNDPNVGKNPDLAVDSKEKTYWWRLIYNYMQHGTLDANSSWQGTRIVYEVKSGIGAGFVNRAYDFVDPDIILIHGGTNDCAHEQKTPLGSYTWDLPVGQLDLTCYRSSYIQLIKMLQTRYEGVQIIIVIGDMLYPDYESSTVEIAKHFGIPYVDFVGDNVEKCSGSHPNAPAFDKMAAKIYNTCKDYLP